MIMTMMLMVTMLVITVMMGVLLLLSSAHQHPTRRQYLGHCQENQTGKNTNILVYIGMSMIVKKLFIIHYYTGQPGSERK